MRAKPLRLYCRITALRDVLQNEAEQQDVVDASLSHGWRIDAVPNGAVQGAKVTLCLRQWDPKGGTPLGVVATAT